MSLLNRCSRGAASENQAQKQGPKARPTKSAHKFGPLNRPPRPTNSATKFPWKNLYETPQNPRPTKFLGGAFWGCVWGVYLGGALGGSSGSTWKLAGPLWALGCFPLSIVGMCHDPCATQRGKQGADLSGLANRVSWC